MLLQAIFSIFRGMFDGRVVLSLNFERSGVLANHYQISISDINADSVFALASMMTLSQIKEVFRYTQFISQRVMLPVQIRIVTP